MMQRRHNNGRRYMPVGSSGSLHDSEDAPLRPHAGPIEITFEHLGLTLKRDPTKTIIRGVTGTFPPRSVTAIMGPSGAGKTSLLNVILDRAYYGNGT